MIEVQHPGIYSSVQDLGRFGNRRFGVPLSGVMDKEMAIAANLILGNPGSTAVLEFASPGPRLFFSKPAIIAVAGAATTVRVNGEEVNTESPILVETNSLISFGRATAGVWSYLSVKGGILSPEVLGSRSFFPGVTKSGRIEAGDILEVATLSELSTQEVAWGDKLPQIEIYAEVQVYPGPEFSMLSEIQKLAILESEYEVSPQSNRMATLVHTSRIVKVPEITTGPVQPGTVQVTPSGKMVVLMRDAQTTGGYSRVLQLSDIGFSQITRISPGKKFRFGLLQ
ncbi:biotin-dependent carboxyltransferase family protein [Aureitalea sp. L0-47]|uniref:5-oxoprolinase subunit C family protein n=1 Tax=Aureitalea sp. L0-47 TaxID=2816962 RepID=UPI002238FD06|nr:biotin-dependent carboxyltransferase family protein [Aureitalea sp. L0-47]MCW5520579.1 biotin-dependent carboxyltransferase family protein [Aureitalea sp. L0-47]